MNIVSVKTTEAGYAIDHLVDTPLGQQTWTSHVDREHPEVLAWIAAGNAPLPADPVAIPEAQPTIADLLEALPQSERDAVAAKVAARSAAAAAAIDDAKPAIKVP